MTCPRCGNEWDVSKSPCSRCGLLVHLPGSLGSPARAYTSPQNGLSQPGGTPPGKQTSQSVFMQSSPTTPPPNPLQGGVRKSYPAQPRPSVPYSPSSPTGGHENEASDVTPLRSDPQAGQTITRTGTDTLLPNNVPQRPHASYMARSTDHLAPDAQRPLRPSRLVTNPGVGQRPPMSQPLHVPSTPPPDGGGSPSTELRSLMPGTLLRSGRYRLREMQERQEWLAGVFEALWIAQDAQRSGAQVMLCELATPETSSMVIQSMLRTATMALTSVGRHPHIPTLWDAFSDQGRSFFVFEPADGESLLVRMHRSGRALPEQDVIECCLQITEVLDLLAQQSPPLVHGLIRPEHIVVGRVGPYYMLTNFSIVLAGGATQFIAGMERSHLSPYTAPEFTRGMMDVRSDLYSLVATAYHVVTGSVPTAVNGNVPQAQRLNPNVSSQFDAILAKGLRPLANQRYQRPSELRQDLLMMRGVSGSLSPRGEQRPQQFVPLPTTPAPDLVAQMLPNMLASTVDDIDDQERKLLLPQPEELPPLQERNDTWYAALWLGGILLCLIIVVLLSRGLM